MSQTQQAIFNGMTVKGFQKGSRRTLLSAKAANEIIDPLNSLLYMEIQRGPADKVEITNGKTVLTIKDPDGQGIPGQQYPPTGIINQGGADNSVYSICQNYSIFTGGSKNGNGLIYAGGKFENFGNVRRYGLVQLDESARVTNSAWAISPLPGAGASNALVATKSLSALFNGTVSVGTLLIGGDTNGCNGYVNGGNPGWMMLQVDGNIWSMPDFAANAFTADPDVLPGIERSFYDERINGAYVCGYFGKIGTTVRPGVARYLTDNGSGGAGFKFDSTFNALLSCNADGTFGTGRSSGFGNDVCWASESGSSLYIAQNDNLVGGTTTNYGVIKVSSTGGLDGVWNQLNGPFGGLIGCLAKDTLTDAVYAGGAFTRYDNSSPSGSSPTRTSLVRLTTAGNVDSGFNTSTNFNNVIADPGGIIVQPDGKVLCCGQFTSYGGTTRKYMCRLNTDASLDTSFPDLNPNGNIWCMCYLRNNFIAIGGDFTTLYGGTITRNYFAILALDGTVQG